MKPKVDGSESFSLHHSPQQLEQGATTTQQADEGPRPSEPRQPHRSIQNICRQLQSGLGRLTEPKSDGISEQRLTVHFALESLVANFAYQLSYTLLTVQPNGH